VAADFSRLGAKVDIAGPGQNPTFEHIKEKMIGSLGPFGFEGWLSAHDRGDPRLELCIFPEYIASALEIQECYAYAPQVFFSWVYHHLIHEAEAISGTDPAVFDTSICCSSRYNMKMGTLSAFPQKQLKVLLREHL